MLNRAKRASHIDPPASSYAIMRRARPYRGENPGPGKGRPEESLTPDPELENSLEVLRTFGHAADLAGMALFDPSARAPGSWQRIGGASPPRGRFSQPPRPRVMHEVLLARAAVKRSQGRPRAKD